MVRREEGRRGEGGEGCTRWLRIQTRINKNTIHRARAGITNGLSPSMHPRVREQDEVGDAVAVHRAVQHRAGRPEARPVPPPGVEDAVQTGSSRLPTVQWHQETPVQRGIP